MWDCRSESSGCMEPVTLAIGLSELTGDAHKTLRAQTCTSIVVHLAFHKEGFT